MNKNELKNLMSNIEIKNVDVGQKSKWSDASIKTLSDMIKTQLAKHKTIGYNIATVKKMLEYVDINVNVSNKSTYSKVNSFKYKLQNKLKKHNINAHLKTENGKYYIIFSKL